MDRARHYRKLAEELRSRSYWTPDPETREQLRVAACDFEQIAQEVEEKGETADQPTLETTSSSRPRWTIV